MKKNIEIIDKIDNSLSVLLGKIEHQEYIDFINSSKELKAFDVCLGWNDNEYIITDKMIEELPEDLLNKVLSLVNEKLEEIDAKSK